MASHVIDLTEEEDPISPAEAIRYAFNLRYMKEIDHGKSSVVYRARWNGYLIVVRMTYHPFDILINQEDWNKKTQRNKLINHFPRFFARHMLWGVVSGEDVLFSAPKPKKSYLYQVRFEMQSYLTNKPIPKTVAALNHLYDFLRQFWTLGFTHGDLTLGNLRYNGEHWKIIDLDTLRYTPGTEFDYPTVDSYYWKAMDHRDHHQFVILVNSVEEWEEYIQSTI